MLEQQPRQVTFSFHAGAVAGGADGNVGAFAAPFDGTIESVTYAPISAITGANTNTRKVSVINKGQAGAGAVEMAGIQYDLAVDAAAFDENTVTSSGTAANLDAVAGDVIVWNSLHVGTGMADPGGLVTIKYNNR